MALGLQRRDQCGLRRASDLKTAFRPAVADELLSSALAAVIAWPGLKSARALACCRTRTRLCVGWTGVQVQVLRRVLGLGVLRPDEVAASREREARLLHRARRADQRGREPVASVEVAARGVLCCGVAQPEAVITLVEPGAAARQGGEGGEEGYSSKTPQITNNTNKQWQRPAVLVPGRTNIGFRLTERKDPACDRTTVPNTQWAVHLSNVSVVGRTTPVDGSWQGSSSSGGGGGWPAGKVPLTLQCPWPPQSLWTNALKSCTASSTWGQGALNLVSIALHRTT